MYTWMTRKILSAIVATLPETGNRIFTLFCNEFKNGFSPTVNRIASNSLAWDTRFNYQKKRIN